MNFSRREPSGACSSSLGRFSKSLTYLTITTEEVKLYMPL